MVSGQERNMVCASSVMPRHVWKFWCAWTPSWRTCRTRLDTIDELIEIHFEQVFAMWHCVASSARATSVEEFGVEFDRDLVARVEGIQRQESRCHGSRKHEASSKDSVSELSAILTKATGLYTSDNTKTRPISTTSTHSDEPLITRLDLQLEKEMADPKAMKQMVMLAPLHRQEEDLSADSYVFGRLGKNPVMALYLLFEGWSSHVKSIGRSRDLSEAKKTAVHLLRRRKKRIRKMLGV